MLSRDAQSELLTARICVAILLPGITFIIGMLPLWLSKLFKWNKQTIDSLQGRRAQFILSKLLCFAGGVLLSTSFMHLLPDLEEACAEQVAEGHLPDLGNVLPWPETFLMSGFFFVYLVEEMAHAFVHWQSRAKHPKPVQAHAATPCVEEIQQNVTGNVQSPEDDENKGDVEKPELTPELPVKKDAGHGHSHEGHGHSHAPLPIDDGSVMTHVRNILTIFALSFHCIFEGIAVGMEDVAADVWYLFGAISTHKFIIAFCVGVELLVSGTRDLLIYVYIFIFGFVSFVGIIIGVSVAGEAGADKTVATVTMQGMAAGTIIYVTFFEILQREKNNNENGFLQFLAVFVGFWVMVGMMAIDMYLYLTDSENFAAPILSHAGPKDAG